MKCMWIGATRRRNSSNGCWGIRKLRAGDVLVRREVCRALVRAPHVPIDGTPTAFMSNGKLLAVLLVPGDTLALQAMAVFSRYSLLVRARSTNPQ